MTNSSVRWIAMAVAMLATEACAFAESSASRVDERLLAEIARLESKAAELESGEVHEQLRNGLSSSRKALARMKELQSPLLRLYRLREPFVAIEALAFVGEHPEAARSLDGFEKLWKEEKPEPAPEAARGAGPFLQEALVQAADNRSEKLYLASRPYAKVSSPFSGVYYLGEAKANRKFRAFVASLPDLGEAEAPPSAVALREAQESLEGETLRFFEENPGGRDAIPVSARLKEARELLEAGRLHGATLALLESRLVLSRRSGEPAAGPSSGGAPPEGSLAELFLAVESEDAPKPNFIRSEVLPLYTSLMRSRH